MDHRTVPPKFSLAALGLFTILAAAVLAPAWLIASEDDSYPPYPDGFRRWVHIKSTTVTAAHPAFATEGGIHHIYANPQAVQGYSTGKFPDGAVLVSELVSTVEKNGIISEGPQRRVDAMVKDARRYKETGGWGFSRFYPNAGRAGARLEPAAAQACFECHKRSSDHDFVFSRERE
jgi:hypothetical protein